MHAELMPSFTLAELIAQPALWQGQRICTSRSEYVKVAQVRGRPLLVRVNGTHRWAKPDLRVFLLPKQD